MTARRAPPPGKWYTIFRDVLLLLGGMAGVLHETVFNDGQRPALLAVYVAMMGLTALMRLDEHRLRGIFREDSKKDDEDTEHDDSDHPIPAKRSVGRDVSSRDPVHRDRRKAVRDK